MSKIPKIKNYLPQIVYYTLFAALFSSLVTYIEASDSSQGRIINGTEAVIDNTKYQVSIREVKSDNYYYGTGHKCGGTLVSPNVVLTAAHCFVDYEDYLERGFFRKKDDFYVVMGSLNRFKKTANTLSFGIKERILGLDQFNLKTYYFDIAILILNGSVPVNHPTIQPIPLNSLDIKNGTICQATGWGITEDGIPSSYLMTVDLPILSDEFCLANSHMPAESLMSGMFCAGYMFVGERDACQGDSGGPFVCNKKLAGIVSWGNKCALPRYPGIYTDVKYYRPWIEERLLEAGLSETTTAVIETTTAETTAVTRTKKETTTATTPSNNSANSVHVSMIFLLLPILLHAFNLRLKM